MFTLANKYTFAPDPRMCWLSAFVNSNAGRRCNLKWTLKAHSKSSLIRFPEEANEKQIPESAAFGIECHGLSFDVLDWKELRGRSFEMDTALISGFFMVFQWEEISALELTFRGVSQEKLELEAKGKGYVESAPEYFGADEIDFNIRTWCDFTGVHTDVPINATAPIAFAEDQIKHVLPKYVYANPELIETKHEGRLLGIGVHFPPQGSTRI
jgi:hypothetical protein